MILRLIGTMQNIHYLSYFDWELTQETIKTSPTKIHKRAQRLKMS